MFLEAQGFLIEENILYQDNQSAIKIEENGKRSSGQKTKHFDTRYFWIKDRLKSEGIKVRYCPTEKMIEVFFTKQLQGALFGKFCNVVLGYVHISKLDDMDEDSSSEERVGSQFHGGETMESDKCESSKLDMGSGKEDYISEPEKSRTWIQTRGNRKTSDRENQVKPTRDKLCGSLMKLRQPPVQWKGDDIIQKWSK